MTASARRPRDAAVTLEQVATHAGVSRQTVSNALNAPGKLRAGTLTRVQRSIIELGYRPNRSARSLRTRSTGVIGYAVGGAAERLLPALCAAASATGRDVIAFAAVGADPLAAYEDLLARGVVDGFVVPDAGPGDPRPGWLARRGVPFVSLGRSSGSWVAIDAGAGIELAVRHLHRLGHRRLGGLSWPGERLDAFTRAVTELGVTPELAVRTVDSLDAGRRAAAALLRLADPPTALVAASDRLALGALRAVAERGLVPGVDVRVTGYGDTTLAAVPPGGLTSLREPVEGAARHAVRLLDAAAVGGAPGAVLLAPALVVRGSSGEG